MLLHGEPEFYVVSCPFELANIINPMVVMPPLSLSPQYHGLEDQCASGHNMQHDCLYSLTFGGEKPLPAVPVAICNTISLLLEPANQ